MSEEKAVFNTYWMTELTNEDKEFLNHTMANYRVEYNVPFEQIETLKDACMNELRAYKETQKLDKLKSDIRIRERALCNHRKAVEVCRDALTPRENAKCFYRSFPTKKDSQDSVDMSTYLKKD